MKIATSNNISYQPSNIPKQTPSRKISMGSQNLTKYPTISARITEG